MKKKSDIYTFLIDSERNAEIEKSIHEAITKKAIEKGIPEYFLEDYGFIMGFLKDNHEITTR